jgi:N-acyl homoserine lactone hydrolase
LQAGIESGVPPKNTWNMDMAGAALAELKRLRDKGDTVVSAHDDEQWKELRKTVEYYE